MRLALIGLLALALCGCSGAASPTQDPRALARGAVQVLEAAWLDAANACVATGNVSIAQKCEALLDPARSSLVLAGDAVNNWTDADQKNFPCLLADSVQSLKDLDTMATALGVLPANVDHEIADGANLAQAFLPQCARVDK